MSNSTLSGNEGRSIAAVNTQQGSGISGISTITTPSSELNTGIVVENGWFNISGTGIHLGAGDLGIHSINGILSFGAGNSITGGDFGVVIIGPGSQVVGSSINDMIFDGQAVNFITLQHNALQGPQILSAAQATFTGFGSGSDVGQDLSVQEIQNLDDQRLTHYLDNNTLGLIVLKESVGYFDDQTNTLLIIGQTANDRLISVNSFRPNRTTVSGVREVFGNNPDGRTFDLTDPNATIAVFALDGRDVVRITGYVPADVYGGEGNDYIYGGYGPDVLRGQGGRDYIRGGSGNDMLIGGLGTDYLYGDAGNDISIGGAINMNPNGFFRSYSELRNDIDLWAAPTPAALDALFFNNTPGDMSDDFLTNDGASDVLSDSSGMDAFIIQVSGTGNDRVFGGNGLGDDSTTWTYP